MLTLQSWRGRDIHLNATYAVSLKNGKLALAPLSLGLGRLTLGPFWMERFERPFLHLLPPLRKERVLLNRLADLKIEPQRILLNVRVSAGPSDTGAQ